MDLPETLQDGQYLHNLAAELFPITRSITGDGVRKTLARLQSELSNLRVHEVPSGTPVLDWTIPDEWNAADAYVLNPSGKRVIDFTKSNIHLVSYSTPIDATLSLTELRPHLHVDVDHPNAIPYVTSYYNRTWGFCLTEEELRLLPEADYHAVVDTTLSPGSLTYADMVIPGDSAAEVLISCYICHPSLANNELSGPMVAIGLALWLSSLPSRRYSYRFVFAPETIGAITYINNNLNHLREKVVAGINLTCIGDEGHFSYLASRQGNTPIDRIARRQLTVRPNAVEYTYLDRGSDERHYCMPGVDVPMISLMRTKYGEYSEYHTHLDDLTVVTPTGLQGGLDFARDVIAELEISDYLQSTVLGEPQLGRRGLYHAMHARTVADDVLLRTHILAFADGTHSLSDMTDLFDVPQDILTELAEELEQHGLLVRGPLREPGS